MNLDAIRTRGLEAVAVWRPRPGWEIGGHDASSSAHRLVDGRYYGAVEDRPAYVSFLSARVAQRGRLAGDVEGEALGPRMSADVTDEDDGLSRLPAQGTVTPPGRVVTDGPGRCPGVSFTCGWTTCSTPRWTPRRVCPRRAAR